MVCLQGVRLNDLLSVEPDHLGNVGQSLGRRCPVEWFCSIPAGIGSSRCLATDLLSGILHRACPMRTGVGLEISLVPTLLNVLAASYERVRPDRGRCKPTDSVRLYLEVA